MLFAHIKRRALSTISHDEVYKLPVRPQFAIQMDFAFKSSMMKMSVSVTDLGFTSKMSSSYPYIACPSRVVGGDSAIRRSCSNGHHDYISPREGVQKGLQAFVASRELLLAGN